MTNMEFGRLLLLSLMSTGACFWWFTQPRLRVRIVEDSWNGFEVQIRTRLFGWRSAKGSLGHVNSWDTLEAAEAHAHKLEKRIVKAWVVK